MFHVVSSPRRGWHAALLALTLAGPASASAADFPFPVGRAERAELVDVHAAYGIVEAVNEATLSAQTAGHITEVLFDVDDFVEAGELVARIDDTEHRARVERAKAALEEARARFREADSEFDRITDLFERDLVSESDMDQTEAARRAAQAQLESARAQLEEAEAQLAYTRIKAPYSGYVTERHVQLGEAVNPGSPIISGIDLDNLRVVAEVPQRLIPAVRKRRTATVELDDGRTLRATSLTFFPSAKRGSSTLPVRVNLPQGTEGLFPGLFVRVRFEVGTMERLLVPSEAVVYRSDVTGVYVVDPDERLIFRQVLAGHTRAEDQIEILAGLDEGERVALDPVQASIMVREQRTNGGNGNRGVGS